jgi:hypothetical protein
MKKLFLITSLMFALVGLAEATEITKTSATGTKFQFTATLDAPLMTGNKVKIDFGKGGLKAMTCSAKTCTLSSNALPTGISTATYKVGIYDARNVLQGSTSDGTYVISFDAAAMPVSNEINLGGTPSNPREINFQTKNKIDTNTFHNYFTYHAKEGETIYINTTLENPFDAKWYGSRAMAYSNNAGNSGLAVNGSYVTYTGNLVYTFKKDGIYTFSFSFDGDNGEGNHGGFFQADVVAPVKKPVVVEEKPVVVEEKPVVVIPPQVVELKPAVYTKIANNGSELPDSAILGSNPKDWACTKDNKTDLIWEIKNRDRGLRDWNKTYTLDESVAFVTSVNSQTLCGKNDWRMPSQFELLGIVKSGDTNPSIDTTYFPNTQSYSFWSSSFHANYSDLVLFVSFDKGCYSCSDYSNKGNYKYVRLVR